eukprot:SAG11_NODE_4284_length_1968_cov_148.159444_4_plen_114_part_00
MSDYCENNKNVAKLDFSHEKEKIEECKKLSTDNDKLLEENQRLSEENSALLLDISEFKQEFYNLLCTTNYEVDDWWDLDFCVDERGSTSMIEILRDIKSRMKDIQELASDFGP